VSGLQREKPTSPRVSSFQPLRRGLLDNRFPVRRISFAEVAEIDREARHRFHHPVEIPRSATLDSDGLRPGSPPISVVKPAD
jgi:hypothetical protein